MVFNLNSWNLFLEEKAKNRLPPIWKFWQDAPLRGAPLRNLLWRLAPLLTWPGHEGQDRVGGRGGEGESARPRGSDTKEARARQTMQYDFSNAYESRNFSMSSTK